MFVHPFAHPEHKPVIQAREAETLCGFQLNLVDSYVSMHGGWVDDHSLEGFTWGFASRTPQAADPDFHLAGTQKSNHLNRSARVPAPQKLSEF